MTSKTNKDRLIASTLLAGVASLGAPFGAGLAFFAAATPAIAQDYTNTNLTGTIVDVDGNPVEGATVRVTSDAQGFTRSSTTNASGEWRVPQVPQGSYTITVSREGYATTTSPGVRAQVGAANAYEIVMPPVEAADGEEIVVTATRQVEFSQTTTGTSIDVAELVEREPIARNATALILLAPSAVPASSAFSVNAGQRLAPASISGASGSENAFYINGLNITNFVNGIGGATVPFDFYQTFEVKTGGYQAEFGRALGGVVNAVTKSGSNDFMIAAHVNYAPDELLEDAPDAVTRQYSAYGAELLDYTLEIGGPIIPDRLFFYGIGQWLDYETTTATTGGTLARTRQDDPFYGFKLDGYITDDHHVEFTWFDTSSELTQDLFQFDTSDNSVIGPAGQTLIRQGGESWVARYTGAFTDWLTVSAAYGSMEVDQATLNSQPNVPNLIDIRTTPNITYGNPVAGRNLPFLATREFYRGDVDVFFDMMGEHHVRFGFDHEDTLLSQTSGPNGSGAWTLENSGAGQPTIGVPGANQDFFRNRRFIISGFFEGQSDAIYIQDSWDVSDRLNLSFGWRRDQFSTSNAVGEEFISFDDEQALRLGFSYDVFGDARSKLYGFYGRYYLPLPSNTAFRAATAAIDFDEIFLPTSGGLVATQADIDAIINGGALGAQATGGADMQPCPVEVPSIAAPNTIACIIRNNGQLPPAESVVARNLQSTYEDEYLLGYEQQFNNDWTAGVSLTYRNLGRASEDAKLDQAIRNYCERNGYDLATECGDVSTAPGIQPYQNGSFTYFIINPGEDARVILPYGVGPGNTLTDITLSEEDLPFGELRREYLALTFTLQRAFDGVWGMDAAYTISRSQGNFEGGLQSDLGQVDPGITANYDMLAFLPGQYGLLPNHRAHQLKVRGSYAVTDDFLVGANLTVLSPRHYGCIGAAPPDYADGTIANGAYGIPSNARFCGGVVVDRGSSFDTDWLYRVDLSFRYDLPESIWSFGEVTFRADVFNLFDAQAVQEAWEFGETAINTPDPSYGHAFAYQAPRSVRFGLDWRF